MKKTIIPLFFLCILLAIFFGTYNLLPHLANRKQPVPEPVSQQTPAELPQIPPAEPPAAATSSGTLSPAVAQPEQPVKSGEPLNPVESTAAADQEGMVASPDSNEESVAPVSVAAENVDNTTDPPAPSIITGPERMGLLTDTAETEENQVLHEQSGEKPGHRNQAEQSPNMAPLVPDPKNPASHATTIVPEGQYPYSVLVETFDAHANAVRAVVNFRELGLSTYWVKVDLGKMGVKYRLYTGFFPDIAAAQGFLDQHHLASKPVKPTAHAARIGIYQDKEALAVAFMKTAKAGAMPYILGTSNGQYHLFVGAFITSIAAAEQCRDLIAKGISCEPVARTTLPQTGKVNQLPR